MKKIKLLFFTLLLLMGSSNTVHLASGWPVLPKICPSGYLMAPGFVKYKDGKNFMLFVEILTWKLITSAG